MPRGRSPETKIASHKKRLYASKTQDKIRVAVRPGRLGVWQRFVLNFDAEAPADRCVKLGSVMSGAKAREWAFDSDVPHRDTVSI